jgi:hypothetical protein
MHMVSGRGGGKRFLIELLGRNLPPEGRKGLSSGIVLQWRRYVD